MSVPNFADLDLDEPAAHIVKGVSDCDHVATSHVHVLLCCALEHMQDENNEQLYLSEIGALLHDMIGGPWSDKAVSRAS